VGEYAAKNLIKLNYAVIGAAGYSGMMVWHGGFSGSSLFKIAENGHLKEMMSGILSQEKIDLLPNSITYSETVFSGMNISVALILLIALPTLMWFVGKRASESEVPLPKASFQASLKKSDVIGAEKLDHSRFLGAGIGLLIITIAILSALDHPNTSGLAFIQPNWINLCLLGSCLILHGHFTNFLAAIDDAISGAAGILIQFPLYFGIMGLMKSSGMVNEMSAFFVSISTESTYPIFTFISSGIVNIFVPSGGGQWAVQGPIIVQAATDMGVSLNKSILAMAYGDQLTNMLQPFWALPLLGITGLKARDILPYTLVLMLAGIVIFVGALIVF
jgi:short-chain fatty acids transporter